MANDKLPNDGQWNVQIASYGRWGPHALRVTVTEDFQWRYASQGIWVRAFDPEGQRTLGSVRLNRVRTSAEIPVFPDAFHRWLSGERVQSGHSPEWQRIEKLEERHPDLREFFAEYGKLLHDVEPVFFPPPLPEGMEDIQVFLEIQDENGVAVAREGPKSSTKFSYRWNERVLNPQSPCFGLLPWDCVFKRLHEVRIKICEKLGWNTPDCLAYSSWLLMEPPLVDVVCSLGGSRESPDMTYAEVDGLTSRIRIGGEDFLNAKWPAEVIVHEISHVIDHYAGRSEATRKYARAEQLKRGADARYRGLLGNPGGLSREDWQAALDQTGVDTGRAKEIMKECHDEKMKELVEGECRALFYSLERVALLAETESEEIQCKSDAVRDMIIHLLRSFYFKFDNDDGRATFEHIRQSLKECLDRISGWLNRAENEAIKTSLENEFPVKNNPEVSVIDLLDFYRGELGQ